MNFRKQTTDIDLGDTPIENIFINDYMPTANGTYVKVYLMGYKFAHDNDPSLSIDNQTISRHLSIPLSDVFDAWDFWEKKGIIKKHYFDREDKTQYAVEFLSLRQLVIQSQFQSIQNPNTSENTVSGTYTCSPQDLLEANKVPEIKDMFYHINQLVRRSLVPNEMMDILEWIYNYNMDPDLIIHAFMYCIEQKKVKNVKYVGAVMRNWYDNGITSVSKLEDYLSRTDERYIFYNKIFKVLGFHSRQPSEAEKSTMDRWIDEWKFSIEMILKACEGSKKTANPSINYINGILLAWKNDNLQNIEDVENKTAPEKNTQKKPSKAANNRFHNFEQRTSKYTNEQLEKLLQKKE